MVILETERISFRELELKDAAFILELLNDPEFIRNIADRKIRTIEGAEQYILNGPMKTYEKHGFGLWLTSRKEDGVPMGICGLIQRDTLPDVDIGYAFLPTFRRKGFGVEAAEACLDYGKRALKLKRIVAITTPGNIASEKLLKKIGMQFEKKIKLTEDAEELNLFSIAY